MKGNYYITKWVIIFAIIASGWMAASGLRAPSSLARMEMGEHLGMAAGIGSGGDAAVRRLPKLRIRAGNRHLIEDENGKPFFIAGVCPQSIIHWSTPDQMDAYFADRQAKHFNFAWVMVNAFDSYRKAQRNESHGCPREFDVTPRHELEPAESESRLRRLG